MAKNRISAQDFLDLMDEESEPQMAAFRPTLARKSEPDSIQATSLDKASDALSAPKTDSKRVANRQQTDGKRVAESDSKQVANGEQSITPISETGSTTGSNWLANGEQLDSKRVAKTTFFESLVGHERNLLLLIFAECQRIGNLVSSELTLPFISESLRCTPGTAKSAIVRLVEKGFVSRSSSKTGRGGWIKFSIAQEVYKDLRIRETDSKQVANGEQLDSKRVAQRVAQRVADPSCSSSIINKNNTTTTEPTKSVGEVDSIWLNVPKNLSGFVSIKQLREFVRQELISEEALQTSLDAFAFDLENGAVRAKTGNPISILIGALKNGGYISHAFSAAVQKELDEIKKRLIESQKKNEEMVALKLELEFEEFREKNPAEAEAIKPALFSSHERGSVGYRMWMDEYRSKKAPRNPLGG